MDLEATGIENIYLRGFVLGMSKGEIDEKIEGIAEFTELGDFLHLPVKTYSVGMFSRLGFAISTAISPDILLIDEGIGAGDAGFIEKVNKRMNEFLFKTKIILFASHNQQLLDSICHKKLRVDTGRLLEMKHA
jgi:ABC-2 type transport system ATP-binding protein/lipopolysaccharide transport system ATP-binding protein